jgi:hypothetical protein
VITGKRSAHAAAVPPGTVRTLSTPDGTPIRIEVSPSYPDTPQNQQAAQNIVNFLGSRVHGAELGKLGVYVGKPAEIHVQCGAEEAVACYYPREARMYVPGETDPTGIPTEYAITHEYGHHIATNRENPLGEAFAYGPEYWASFVHVCAGVQTGEFSPGDQDQGYLDNPGEGWADAYAHLPENGFADAPFQFNLKFRPTTEVAYAAVRRDVLDPWTGPATQSFTGSLRRRSAARFTQNMTIDGNVVARLSGPRSANFDLQVLVDGQVVDRSRHSGSRERVAGTACGLMGTDGGPGPITFRVVQRSGTGAFRLVLSYPG